jgi:hypothetical protein
VPGRGLKYIPGCSTSQLGADAAAYLTTHTSVQVAALHACIVNCWTLCTSVAAACMRAFSSTHCFVKFDKTYVASRAYRVKCVCSAVIFEISDISQQCSVRHCEKGPSRLTGCQHQIATEQLVHHPPAFMHAAEASVGVLPMGS